MAEITKSEPSMDVLSKTTRRMIEHDIRRAEKLQKKAEEQELFAAMTDEEKAAFRKEKRKQILKRVGIGVGATAAVGAAAAFAAVRLVSGNQVDEDEIVEDEDSDDETVEYPEEE